MPESFRLDPDKRVLFLTKDPDLIRRQLAGELNLRMEDLRVEDLLDDVNTDAMTPAWVCFDHRPEDLARNAYAGLIVDGERLFGEGALIDGGFEVIVSGERKGVGSSRETAVQAEKWSGIKLAVADSFAPIHARNNVNQGVLMAGHDVLVRLQRGEEIPFETFTEGLDAISAMILACGGIFPFYAALKRGEIELPPLETGERPMTMGEKLIARHLPDGQGAGFVQPGDSVVARVDGGYSHEFTTAQVDHFLTQEVGEGYTIENPDKFAVFEDHLVYADGVEKMAPFSAKIEGLRQLQRAFQKKTGVRDYGARDGRSPGICHQVAREDFVDPGDFIQATDSHTCMGGGNNALAFGVGATEYAALAHYGYATMRVPESIRFELVGELKDGVTAKDVMLWILWKHAREGDTLDRIMEFTGPGLATMDMDERATLANMATECSAKTGIVQADEKSIAWLAERRGQEHADRVTERCVVPDEGAVYAGGTHVIDLSTIEPLVANPGDPDRGIPSDPTNGQPVGELDGVSIDIAYGGSCTAGKETDLRAYAEVLEDALGSGRQVADGVRFYIQFGSERVERWARAQGYIDIFERAGVELIAAGCGACIGCGPGVSDHADQVTVSAINRNYRGRSGPGKLWLASPPTVAASAVAGKIVSWERGMFAGA